jgi:type IX secretion system PorP/SprF family membrane protein
LSINSFYRAQWVGLEGAPKTISLSINTPVGRRGVGLGLSVVQDEIGPAKETFAAVDFSYTINTSEKTKLSFGLKGGGTLLNVNFSDLNFNPLDPNATNIINRIFPTIGAGLYLHSEDKWYVGLSSPNLLKIQHYNDGNSFSNVTNEASAYLMAGYVFDLNENLKFKPAALLKTVTGAPISLDLSANFLIYQKFTLGASYRLNAAVSGLAGIQISDSLMFGYTYDYDTTEFGSYNSGSHEVFLRIELPTRRRAIINPRCF